MAFPKKRAPKERQQLVPDPSRSPHEGQYLRRRPGGVRPLGAEGQRVRGEEARARRFPRGPGGERRGQDHRGGQQRAERGAGSPAHLPRNLHGQGVRSLPETLRRR